MMPRNQDKAMAGNTENGSGRHESRWSRAVWSTAALLPLLPALAMPFTEEVAWDLADFVVFAAMLAVACGTYELASRLTHNSACQAAIVARLQPHGMANALSATAFAQALVAVIALITGMGFVAKSFHILLETLDVTQVKFCDVDESFALAEGENDDLPGWWHDHRQYFERNGGFDTEMILVCERFALVRDFGSQGT
jgi:ASCH domain-containing protein